MLRLRRIAIAAAAALVGIGQPAAAQDANGWQPSDDDALLFDVRLGQYRLGDGIRGYQTPEGVCIDFADTILALDIPIEIDKAKRVATGWAFEERNRLSVDRSAARIKIADRQLTLDPTTIRDTPEGWCVSAKELSSWLGVELAPDLGNALLFVKSKSKLPVELAAERKARAARVRPTTGQQDLSKLPQAKLPYQLWRTPSLDAVVTIGGLSDKRQGKRLDRTWDLYASGELAYMSVDARLSSDTKGAPQDFRMRAYRSDANGGLLGPLRATHFEVGDVTSLSSPLVGIARTGRGFMVTNRPLDRPETFDRKTFRGELPTGWDAELYRNSQLLAVAQTRNDGRYEFADVPLLFGQNVIEIVLYGPQGQVRRNREVIAVGQESIPPKKTWYWAGISQEERDVLSWRHDPAAELRGWRGSFGVERGIDQKTSLSAQVHSLVIDDERLTYVEGAVRRSVGPALLEIGGSWETRGGFAGRAQLLGQFGNTYVAAESIIARGGFLSDRVNRGVTGSHILSLEHAFDLGKIAVPLHAEARYIQRSFGSDSLEAGARLSATIDRVSITGAIDWRTYRGGSGTDPPDQLEAALLANASVGKTRLRGEMRWRISPESEFESASVIAERPIADRASVRGEIGYDGGLNRFRGGLGYVREFDRFALSVVGEAATDGSVAAGLNLALSLGPSPRGGIRVASQKLAASGSVLARVFRDEDSDGVRDPTESYEKDVQLLVGRVPIERVTNDRGEVFVDGLEPHLPILLGVDGSSLPDPLVQPAGPGVAVTARPGLPMVVDLPLVGAGEILGTLLGANGSMLEGVDIELVDPKNNVIAVARSDYDGFFLFESVPYGNYSLRLTKLSANVIGLPRELNLRARLDRHNPSVRLGRVTAGEVAPLRLAYQDVLFEGIGTSAVMAP